MHPALSVIVFTTATGAGYGLLALLGVLAALGTLPPDRPLGVASLGLALVLITGGLLSSTLHLGRPERARRAFSQWRSSWLSREGIASLITYVPAGLFGIAWIAFGRTDGIVAIVGLVTALCAAATVICTGMIYASLKPVAQWHTSYTVPIYLVLALMSGAVILDAVLFAMNMPIAGVSWVALTAILAGWLGKTLVWRHNDALRPPASANSATGLMGGEVRSIEWPHTEENYVLKEMGYRVARKHAAKLRLFVHVFAFAAPLLATAAAMAAGGVVAVVAAVIAVVVMAPGLLVERWLFFAEARHTVTLYYGR
jgi:DMSO reductase anchor subunit